MIPELPAGITDKDTLEFYDKLAGNLSDQSTVHVHWWTHRQNPSVCWICDVNIIITKLIELADKNITKSTVDMETCSMSENEQISEIEEASLNKDEELPIPEYETEE